jgi:hypothetical protein
MLLDVRAVSVRIHAVAHPACNSANPYEIMVTDGRVHDIDDFDWDRWCEYILYRGMVPFFGLGDACSDPFRAVSHSVRPCLAVHHHGHGVANRAVHRPRVQHDHIRRFPCSTLRAFVERASAPGTRTESPLATCQEAKLIIDCDSGSRWNITATKPKVVCEVGQVCQGESCPHDKLRIGHFYHVFGTPLYYRWPGMPEQPEP